MLWVYRWLAVGVAVVILVLLWMYPAPAVYRVEVPDWADSYDRLYQAPSMTLGSMALFQETMRQSRNFVTFSDYLHDQIHSYTLAEIPHSLWQEHLPQPGALPGTEQYFAPDHPLFAETTTERGLLQLVDSPGIHLYRFMEIPARRYDRYSLPTDLQYPLRSGGIWYGLGALVSLALVHRMPFDSRVASSSVGTASAVLAVMFVCGAALMAWPFLYNLADIDLSYASIIVGLLLGTGAAAGLILTALQIRTLDSLFSGRDRLVHWVIPADEWKYHWEQRFREQRFTQTKVWIAVNLLSVGITGYIAFSAAGSWASAALGIAVITAVFWKLLLLWSWQRQKRIGASDGGDVLVGMHGLYNAGEIHRWAGVLSRFLGAELTVESQKPYLLISYAQLSGQYSAVTRVPMPYWQHISVRVPVPLGREKEAQAVAEGLIQEHGLE